MNIHGAKERWAISSLGHEPDLSHSLFFLCWCWAQMLLTVSRLSQTHYLNAHLFHSQHRKCKGHGMAFGNPIPERGAPYFKDCVSFCLFVNAIRCRTGPSALAACAIGGTAGNQEGCKQKENICPSYLRETYKPGSQKVNNVSIKRMIWVVRTGN